MAINVMSFLLGNVFARRRGLEQRDATQVAFVSSLVNPPEMGIVIGATLARRRAEALPPAGTTGTNTGTTAVANPQLGTSRAAAATRARRPAPAKRAAAKRRNRPRNRGRK